MQSAEGRPTAREHCRHEGAPRRADDTAPLCCTVLCAALPHDATPAVSLPHRRIAAPPRSLLVRPPRPPPSPPPPRPTRSCRSRRTSRRGMSCRTMPRRSRRATCTRIGSTTSCDRPRGP
eukprot:6850349-Prymnesium_polylepis.3